MPNLALDVASIPNLRRFENFPKEDMNAECLELTHSVYSHEEIYGKYCTLQAHIECPPEEVFRYLADGHMLAEWTYSMRDFEPTDGDVLLCTDKIGGQTKIYTRVVANKEAMTVDYHCAWDQGDKLWMIYLMRVIPAELVLNRSGSVVVWTNCRHPFYDENPFPQKAPRDRKVWVGDLWPFFYAGHHVELQNLKQILEYRHAHAAAAPARGGAAEAT